MSKQTKKAVVGLFMVLTVVVLISMFILGVNLMKNRWHKLDFTVYKISVTEKLDKNSDRLYHLEVTGTVKPWFYDFNTYSFNLTDGSSGEYIPENFKKSNVIRSNRKQSNDFFVSFDTYNLDDVKNYTLKGENIFINGSTKEGTDIRLFLSEYEDKIVFEN
ncbi:MAG: hypothetical protein IJL63_01865 [Clostridia bacterium]|nr:hypothetical protein [Clostridia bacterium]